MSQQERLWLGIFDSKVTRNLLRYACRSLESLPHLLDKCDSNFQERSTVVLPDQMQGQTDQR